jgi:serine/threonine protein phosphatase PrpC
MRPDVLATVALNGFGASDAGRVREHNEDRFHCDPARGIFIVVDGVGGHAGGGRAADLALQAVRARLERDTGSTPDRLREAITSANEAIFDEARRRPELAGMSCVLTALVVCGDRLVAGHVGDTRLYKLRAGQMVKLTHDHSPVGDLEDSGQIGEADAMRHPQRNLVWRDVGTAPHRPGDPDFVELVEDTFEPDAALLLCSDGLSDLVNSARMASAVYAHAGSPERAAQALVAAANEAGGRDNATALVIEGPEFAGAGMAAGLPARGAAHRVLPLLSLALAIAAVAILSPPGPASPRSVRPADIEASAVQPRILRVGATPGSDTETIAAALAQAHPGDTVVVDPGVYRESVVLREGVDVVSAERRGAELRRPADAVGNWTAVVAADISSGSIRGFRIIGSDTEALHVGVYVRDAIASIEDVEVSGARHSAIQIAGVSAPTVHGCALHGNAGFGLQIQDFSAPAVSNTAIVSNGRRGIDIGRDARPVLSWNVVKP